MKVPKRREAQEILRWAEEMNPGPWGDHSRNAARAAEMIAGACGMDVEIAHVMGLLHDIGRYEGVRGMHHIVVGYELMMENGYDDVARICLSHSFPYPNIDAYCGAWDVSEAEKALVIDFLQNAAYDDYDRLIQLVDALATPGGIGLIDARLLDVIRRYGISKCAKEKIDATFELFDGFSARCGGSVYGLFGDEVARVSLPWMERS